MAATACVPLWSGAVATATACVPHVCEGVQSVCPGPTVEQGVRAVHELHLDAVQGLLGWLNVQQVQDDGLVRAKHVAAGHHGGQGVADLA